MSFGDLYQVQPGQDVASNLPPVNLPQVKGDRQPLRITVTPKPAPAAQSSDPWAMAGFVAAPAAKAEPEADPWAAAGFSAEVPKEQPKKEVSATKAFARSAETGLTLGLGPAVEGAAEASGLSPELEKIPFVNLVRPIVGAAKLAVGAKGAKAAYERGRSEAQAELEAGREQHPVAAIAGELGGAALVPIPGSLAGNLGARIAKGAVTGALGAGAYGAGSAISEGKDASGVISGAERGALIGAPLGGVLGAALGRAAPGAATRGQRATQTAEDLGAPLPRGLATDSRALQATTAKLRSVPFAGERIGHAVEKTAEASGKRIGDIAESMTGGATGRAAADVVVRPGIQGVIDRNKQHIDTLYSTLRSHLQGHSYTMPNLQAALDAVIKARRAAGHANPESGLEQFQNVARGTTFEGAHRARVDAREAGNVLVPHPGYNKGDYNRLTAAMSADLRNIVKADAKRGPQRAAQAFDLAEKEFGKIAEQNKILHRLLNSKGEGAIATLLGAAKEKGGNLRLLAQLKNSMSSQDFEQVGGTLLHELSHNPTTGEFSLAKFVTNWNRVSERAKNVLFSQQHLKNIEDIVNLGTHIKGALRESNTSHTASVLVLLDLAKDAALLGADIASGGLGAGSAIGAGSSAAIVALTRWLGSPAKAASMSAWTKAYQAVASSPTPARIATFRVATRNLSNNLGIPMEKIAGFLQGPARAPAEEQKSP